jgi:hypothetical protein
MRTFINRDWSRPEEDDFKLNVEPAIDTIYEAIPIHGPLNPSQHSAATPDPILGWKIQLKGE